MAFVNYNNKEITAKIVYYGPALSGKTTCLRYIFSSPEIENKGKLITLDTDGDRTLFFDFLPLEIGKLGNYSIKIQLYTVPGQVAYDTTRKLVLQGADGVVFVADSQVITREQNIESFGNLKKNIKLNNLTLNEIPLIFQYNKRDLKEILPIDILNKDLNPEHKSFFPTIAPNGENVLEGLHSIIKLVIIHLKNKLSIFQKDKTVMFSREETITASSRTEEKKNPFPQMNEVSPGRSRAEEEIFELAAPFLEISDRETHPTFEDDVFNLESAQEIGKEKPDNTESEEAQKDVTPQKRATFDLTDINQVISLEMPEKRPFSEPTQSHTIPISIQVPGFNEEIKINLNLQITLKKKP